MPCPTPCWDYTHRAGRCKCGTDASRAALGLPPLHTENGGMQVDGRLSFPIEREEDDTPPETPESAGSIWKAVQSALALIAIAALALAAAALRSKGAM